MWKMSAIHIPVENMTALSCLLKMGVTNLGVTTRQVITITYENLPGNLN